MGVRELLPARGSSFAKRRQIVKILMVSHYFGSHQGGIELVAGELFRGLADAGCEITWTAAGVTPPPDPIGSSRTCAMRAWNGIESVTGLPFPVLTPGALRLLRQEVARADVVLLHDCLYLGNIAAYIFARRCGVPVVCIQHIGFVAYRNPLLRALMRLGNWVITKRMLRKAQQVVFISEITRRYFNGIAYQRPPMLVFNGVDTDLFHPPQDRGTKTALRKRFALPEQEPVALFVGRFVEKKGLKLLRRMAAAAPQVMWALAGWGPIGPTGWGLPNVKVFSSLRGASLADLYRACDVLVLPSVGEGFPLVIQEALASGLPVVCGEETATADRLASAFVRGVAMNGGEEETASAFLAGVSEQLAADNPEKNSLVRHEFAVSRYSWKAAVDSYLAISSAVTDARKLEFKKGN
jgi:glycosyltransferase involved in cell wall biosynthesis